MVSGTGTAFRTSQAAVEANRVTQDIQVREDQEIIPVTPVLKDILVILVLKVTQGSLVTPVTPVASVLRAKLGRMEFQAFQGQTVLRFILGTRANKETQEH
jgi:hypothetical protein